MSPKPSKDLALNSGAYVLNALSETERAQFESLLAESEENRAEVTELADTAVELGLSVEPIEPSAALRERILDLVAQTPQLSPLVQTEPEAVSDASLTEAPVMGLAEQRAQRRWFNRPVVTLVAVAAAVALVFGGGIAVNSALQGPQSTTASQINQIQAAADYQRSTVKVATGGTATLVWSNSMHRSAIMVKDIAKLPDSKTYELWYISKDGPKSAGTFNADGSLQAVVLDGKMGAGDTIGMTVEPAGGSKKPTTNPVVVVTTA